MYGENNLLSIVLRTGYRHDSSPIQQGEERVELPAEMPCEGIDVRFVLHVVERDLALLVVDVYSHLPGHQHERQRSLRVCAGIELSRAPPQGPVTLRGLHGEAAMPLRGRSGDSDSPVAVVC